MQLEGVGHHHGLQEVALELVHEDHNDQHQQRDKPSVGNQGYQCGEDTGCGGTNDRDKRTEEHQHRQGKSKGNPESEEADTDGSGVHGGDRRCSAHVATHHPNAGDTDAATAFEALTLEGREEKRPDLRAVLEEKEQDHDGEYRARDEFTGHGDSGDSARAELAAGEEPHHRIDGGVDLLLVDRQRSRDEELLQLVNTVFSGGDEFVGLVLNGEDNQRDDAAEDQDAREEGDPGGEHCGKSALFHPPHHGGRGRGDDQCDEHGDHHQLQLDESEDEHGGQSQKEEDLSAAKSQPPESIGED